MRKLLAGAMMATVLLVVAACRPATSLTATPRPIVMPETSGTPLPPDLAAAIARSQAEQAQAEAQQAEIAAQAAELRAQWAVQTQAADQTAVAQAADATRTQTAFEFSLQITAGALTQWAQETATAAPGTQTQAAINGTVQADALTAAAQVRTATAQAQAMVDTLAAEARQREQQTTEAWVNVQLAMAQAIETITYTLPWALVLLTMIATFYGLRWWNMRQVRNSLIRRENGNDLVLVPSKPSLVDFLTDPRLQHLHPLMRYLLWLMAQEGFTGWTPDRNVHPTLIANDGNTVAPPQASESVQAATTTRHQMGLLARELATNVPMEQPPPRRAVTGVAVNLSADETQLVPAKADESISEAEFREVPPQHPDVALWVTDTQTRLLEAPRGAP